MMKRAFTFLMVLVLCVGVFAAQTNNAQPREPVEWLLSIKSYGAPWEKKFEVELNQTGLLSVKEEDRTKIPNDPVTRLTIKVPAGNLQEIYQQALVVAQKVGVKERSDLADGTWMTIKLTTDGKDLVASYRFGVADEEVPNVAKLFALINKYVPPEHHVY